MYPTMCMLALEWIGDTSISFKRTGIFYSYFAIGNEVFDG